MEDLYPIAEGGPKYRGKQSIKLRIRFEREGYIRFERPVGEDFFSQKKKKKKNLADPPGGSNPGDTPKYFAEKFSPFQWSSRLDGGISQQTVYTCNFVTFFSGRGENFLCPEVNWARRS